VAAADLNRYIDRPLTPPAPEVLAAVESGPIHPVEALPRDRLDRLLDPDPTPVETGWSTLDDGVGYVACRTAMPDVTPEMVDWWFDWHPRDPQRYRVWHPPAHQTNSLEPAAEPGAKPFWGTVHHPVEDVGVGMAHARIEFVRPTEIGFSTDALDDPRVGTIVCGWAGDDARRVRHTPMVHVFLRDGGGVVLRSRFWLGAAMRPYLPGALGDSVGWAINRRFVRSRAMPDDLPRKLARHCAEEYANFATLVPELHAAYA
jgi:hypothetical protein